MTAAGDQAHVGLMDWQGTARRLRRIAVGLTVLILAVFVVVSLQRGTAAFGLLGELVGLGLLAAFVIEVVVVGGTALRAMLTAGERGERLASQDVGLLPPQVLRRARGEAGCGPEACGAPATAQDQPGPDAGNRGRG